MECMAAYRNYFLSLEWDKAYFSNPEAYFSSVIAVSTVLDDKPKMYPNL
jgi:hypothetical protein